MKKVENYFSKHVSFNSAVHLLAGIGIGVLLTHPLFDGHTVRFGLAFLALGLLGHLYPLLVKK